MNGISADDIRNELGELKAAGPPKDQASWDRLIRFLTVVTCDHVWRRDQEIGVDIPVSPFVETAVTSSIRNGFKRVTATCSICGATTPLIHNL